MKAFARNQCCTHSAVHEPMSSLSYSMKFLVSCSHRSASKTIFAFMDFLPSAVYLCVMLLLGGNGISIHSLYPFHLRHSLDRGPLESVPLTQKRFTMGRQHREIKPGHGGACLRLCGHNEFQKKWGWNVIQSWQKKKKSIKSEPVWENTKRSTSEIDLN